MKYGKWVIVLFIILFLPFIVKAYDYANEKNKSGVVHGRQSIHELYDLYEELFPTPEDNDEGFVEDNVCGSSSYTWPIGSDNVTKNGNVEMAMDEPNTVNITSTFGPRTDPINGTKVAAHGAIDIAPSAEAGKVNVIAAQSGEVTVAQGGCTSYGDKSCGGGYGNYIVIKHDDGNYTLYAHLHQNSLKVRVGDKVSQGQVIAKVGSSGRSTGTHLHFQIHEGEYNRQSRVDPLNYVDPKKPRPESGDSCDSPADFLNFIHGMESGEVYNPNASGFYEAKDKHDGQPWTIGPGLTPDDKQDFIAVGIDYDKITEGTTLPKKEVEKAFVHTVNRHIDDTKNYLKNHNISLNNSQILSLTSFHYNYGKALSDFNDDYKKYGNSPKLFSTFCNISHAYGHRLAGGLVKRRKLEWIMYTTGIIINGVGSDGVSNSPHSTQISEGRECVGNFNIPNSEKSKVNSLLEKTASEFNGKITFY